jgi:hypothetical protein
MKKIYRITESIYSSKTVVTKAEETNKKRAEKLFNEMLAHRTMSHNILNFEVVERDKSGNIVNVTTLLRVGILRRVI